MNKLDHQESTTITFEWVVRGLKNLFESSKGEVKSKVTKSMKFGGGRWQIFFYANSGTEGGMYVSLYLSCEPTVEEKEKAPDGKWVREGVFKFGFELRSTQRTLCFNSKEAHNHSFSWKTANWGWAQFAKRDHVYYHSNAVKDPDSFLVTCTISSSPEHPAQPPAIPTHLVPKDLLETVGALLDDPVYSDVEFILPSRGRGLPRSKKIWANQKILQRADYFQTMFASGFAETSSRQIKLEPAIEDESDLEDVDASSRGFEDSDDEDESSSTETIGAPRYDVNVNVDFPASLSSHSRAPSQITDPDSSEAAGEETADESSGIESQDQRLLRSDVSRQATPKTEELSLDTRVTNWHNGMIAANIVPGPKKMRIIVRDVAYKTYKAVLYYIYTDVIMFAPLSSSFGPSPQARAAPLPSGQVSSESTPNLTDNQRQSDASAAGQSSRKEWIKEWQKSNPGRTTPCSAKAVYRLADKLGLLELKERAFQHIQKSLTTGNIPYEVFSPFSAMFSEVRKVQIKFFLEHWGDIRTSEAMRNVWQQIRAGRHPGFEEVWPVIAQNLEFNPQSGDLEDSEGSEN